MNPLTRLLGTIRPPEYSRPKEWDCDHLHRWCTFVGILEAELGWREPYTQQMPPPASLLFNCTEDELCNNFVADPQVAARLWLCVSAMKTHGLHPFHPSLQRTVAGRPWVGTQSRRRMQQCKTVWDKGQKARTNTQRRAGTGLQSPCVGDLIWIWWESTGWFQGRVREWAHWQTAAPMPGHVWVHMLDGDATPLDLDTHVWSFDAPIGDTTTSGGKGVHCSLHGWTLKIGSSHNLEPPPHVQMMNNPTNYHLGLRSGKCGNVGTDADRKVGQCVWNNKRHAWGVCVGQSNGGRVDVYYPDVLDNTQGERTDTLVWFGHNYLELPSQGHARLRAMELVCADDLLEAAMQCLVEMEDRIGWDDFATGWSHAKTGQQLWAARARTCQSWNDGERLIEEMATHLISWQGGFSKKGLGGKLSELQCHCITNGLLCDMSQQGRAACWHASNLDKCTSHMSCNPIYSLRESQPREPGCYNWEVHTGVFRWAV